MLKVERSKSISRQKTLNMLQELRILAFFFKFCQSVAVFGCFDQVLDFLCQLSSIFVNFFLIFFAIFLFLSTFHNFCNFPPLIYNKRFAFPPDIE